MKKLPIITTLTVILAISFQLSASADVPHLIGYQGRLTDADGDPREGSFKITFRIYDAEAAGNLLWQEIHPNVTVTGGIFDILLGSVTALDLPFDKQYYLAIQVGSDPEMTPRQQIASVGYAYKSEETEEADHAQEATNADTIDSIHASTTPEANKLLALDSSRKFPANVLKTYDSGWFAATIGGTYTKTHNLGTTTLLVQVWWSASSNGNNPALVPTTQEGSDRSGQYYSGAYVHSLTNAQLTVQAGADRLLPQFDSNGNLIDSAKTGYYRVVAIALE